MGKEYNCPACKKEIIKDIINYLEKYPEEKWVQCPYCGWYIPMEKIKKQNEDLDKL